MFKLLVEFICLFYVVASQQSREGIGDGTVQVLFLQRSSVPSAASWARLINPFPILENFTTCYRIRMHRYREESTLMSYAVSDSKDNELRMDHRESGFKVSVHSDWASTNIQTKLGYWTHYCITLNSFTEEWVIYENGLFKGRGFLAKYDGPLEGNGSYVIGQEHDSLAGNFQENQSFSGEITELNFWSKVLDPDMVKKIYSCDNALEGDTLAWSQLKWNTNGETEWISTSRSKLCKDNPRVFEIFRDRFNLRESLKLCEINGGVLAVPQNLDENSFLYEISKNYSGYCSGNLGSSYMWLGANDIENERSWVYSNSDTPIPWEGPWRGGNPNGGNVENCMVMLKEPFPAEWSDIACLDTYSFCVPCEFKNRVPLYLKGPLLCSTSPYNYEYFLEGLKNDRPLISGTLHSEIFWDNKKENWILKSHKHSKAFARYVPVEGNPYPFGKKPWIIDTPMCEFAEGDMVNLTLSSCGKGKFTCQDGSCISLSLRCDLRLDCEDGSDESECFIIEIPPGYMRILPPLNDNPEEPLPVLFTIDVISFPSIKTQDLIFEVTLQLKLKWKDSRLKFKNLKEEKTLNVISKQSLDLIWTPSVFFKNAFDNIYTNLDEGSKVHCIHEGTSTPGPKDKSEEMNIFSGEENSLEMEQYYQAAYSCDFQLIMFPFDAQVCTMDFSLVSASSLYMELVPSDSLYSGSKDLIEYGISKVSLNQSTLSGYSSVRVSVRFTRRYGFYLLTLYIPTVLLVIIAYATLYFNPADFNSRIVVALTALLVLSSLFTQTSNSLPKTSYFKLVDIWLFFAIVNIFIIVLFQTVAEYFSYENLRLNKMSARVFKSDPVGMVNPIKAWQGKDKKYCGVPLSIAILFTGRIFIPALFAVFNIAYWGSAVSYLVENVWPYEE